MMRTALQTPRVGEIGVYLFVRLTFQFEIELVQQFFLVREVHEERARGNTGASGDLRCRRTQTGFGNLVYSRLEDRAAFLSASDSCHPIDESTVVRRLESRQ